LNLCTDEYLLLLARPEEIASVSYLARDPRESPLWRTGRGFPGNDGSMESVLATRPTLILAMGGGGRMRGAITGRLGITLVDVPPAQSVATVAFNLALVGRVIGHPERASPWIRRLNALQASAPSRPAEAVWLSS